MKKPIQKQKIVQKFAAALAPWPHVQIILHAKAKFEFLPTAFAVILKPVALPIVPKVEFNFEVHYQFCFLSPKSCLKICDLSLKLT